MSTNTDFNISEGAPLTASTFNTSFQNIGDQIDTLKGSIRDVQTKSATVLSGITLESSDISIGDVVYFSNEDHKFHKALCATHTTIAGMRVSNDSMQVAGIVSSKNGTLGSITVDGYYEGPLSIENVDSRTESELINIYYLSSATPGYICPAVTKTTTDENIVTTPEPISIPICTVTSVTMDNNSSGTTTYTAIVKPQWFSFAERHKHYKWDLVAAPTSDFTAGAAIWYSAQESSHPACEGWVIEQGTINSTEYYAYYNIAASSFSDYWPPVPLNGALLMWRVNPSSTANMSPSVTVIPSDFYLMTAEGIYWLNQDYAPFNTSCSYSYSDDVLTVTKDNVTQDINDYESLYWTSPIYNENNTIVESITAQSPITIKNENGDNVSSGDVIIGLDYGLTTATSSDTGTTAIKTINDDGTLNAGPVLTGIQSASSNLVLSGNTISGTQYKYGLVTASLKTSTSNQEVGIDTVHLQNAKESILNGNISLVLPSAVTSSISGRVTVPFVSTASADSSTTSGYFTFVVYSNAPTSEIANLSLSYIVSSPTGSVYTIGSTPIQLGWSTNLTSLSLSATSGYLIESDLITGIKLGSIITFTLTRNSGSTTDPDILILRKSFQLGTK